MADRASIVAFVLSLLGATYQMIGFGLAYSVNNQYNYNYYAGFSSIWVIIATVVVFWAISHLIDSPSSQRGIWPSIIIAMGAANLGNMIIDWSTPVNDGVLGSRYVPAGVIITLIPAPLLLVAGGVF